MRKRENGEEGRRGSELWEEKSRNYRTGLESAAVLSNSADMRNTNKYVDYFVMGRTGVAWVVLDRNSPFTVRLVVLASLARPE
jgi:hypothetical protein